MFFNLKLKTLVVLHSEYLKLIKNTTNERSKEVVTDIYYMQ